MLIFRLFIPRRKLKYATASPTMAYIAHGCRHQWKNAVLSARLAAPAVRGSSRPSGGSA